MTNYKECFDTIAKAVRHDYAGCADRRIFDKSGVYASMLMRTFAQGNLNTETFVSIVNQYLGEYGDRNLRLVVHADDYTKETVGFHVRHYDDCLYVTELMGESRLAPGDRINKINRRDISIYSDGCRGWLYGDTPEREFWSGLLLMQWNINVIHTDGTEEELELQRYPHPEVKQEARLGEYPGAHSGRRPEACLDGNPEENSESRPKVSEGVTFSTPGEGICLLRISRLKSPGELDAILGSHEDELESCRLLVIDLRRTRLGAADAWAPLMPYVISSPMMLSEAFGTRVLWKNYTAGNCRLLGRQYRQYLANADPDTAVMIETLIEELHQKSGRGFTPEEDHLIDAENDKLLSPKAQQAKVVILTDTYCENDGEAFVSRARQLGRAITVGRATMGTLDYTDLAALPVGDKYTLIYPMSKSDAAMNGNGVIGRGIEPDIYIPWTPAECTSDVILHTVCASDAGHLMR